MVARVLCGISSPSLISAKLTRDPVFGKFMGHSFGKIIQEIESADDPWIAVPKLLDHAMRLIRMFLKAAVFIRQCFWMNEEAGSVSRLQTHIVNVLFF